MNKILHTGLHQETLEILQQTLPAAENVFQEVLPEDYKEFLKTLQNYQLILVGEEVGNPIRFAQEAYALDKHISVLLVTDQSTLEKIKQALQFSPFVGSTVKCISNAAGARMAPILEDAMQRTAQRRSFAKIKNASATAQGFVPNVLEKVRTDFTSKVLEEAPIGTVLVSGSGIVFSINNYALRLLKKSEKEVLGTPFHRQFPEQVHVAVRVFLEDVYHQKPKQIFEVDSPQGLQYLELLVAPISMSGAAGYKLVMVNDVTNTVMAQQRTQAHLKELEKLNANLARVNADLDTFVYTASHDLKSPILNIEGLVSSLEDELGPAKEVVHLELDHIKRSILRFKQTVEDLTEVSKIQRNLEEEAVLVDLVPVFDEVKHNLEREITEAGAIITLEAEPGLQVFISKANLASILYNLLSNAIKYRSLDRTLRIRVTAQRFNGEFHLSVADNGLGIPAAKRERVFQLFKRMHSHVNGSGVGLYLVKRIVENNGGSITVESEEGKGSVFRVVLGAQGV